MYGSNNYLVPEVSEISQNMSCVKVRMQQLT